MIRLAWPVVLAEVGWMTMGVVDTLMVGSLGAAAIGAVGLASTLYSMAAIFGMGLLLGLDTLVSQSHGAGKHLDCRLWFVQGCVLALLLSLPIMLVTGVLAHFLGRVGLDPSLSAPTSSYLRVALISTLPLLVFAACRRFLQGIGCVRPVMIALVSANLVNAAVNAVLIQGRFGFPALGVTGAAWATCFARLYMAAVLVIAIYWHEPRRSLTALSWRLDTRRMWRLIVLGLPAAMQFLLEFGVFTAATALVSSMGPEPLAAHHVTLLICSLTFMMPLGLSSAGAVRVGHALGRNEPIQAARAGWTALLLSVILMSLSAACLLLFPRALLSVFTNEPKVLTLGATLLAIAAAFQLFDGLQVVGTGILRGAGETRIPMLGNLVAHWFVGLPAGCYLAFGMGLGVVGLWLGLCLGIVQVGLLLVWAWARKSAAFPRMVHEKPLPIPDFPVTRVHEITMMSASAPLEDR